MSDNRILTFSAIVLGLVEAGLYLFSILFITSCGPRQKDYRKKHLLSKEIGKQLFIEHFLVDSYGVGGDVYGLYLTDSLYFREFVTLYYDHESFESKVSQDNIVLIKLEEKGGVNNIERTKTVVSEFKYSKVKLVRNGKI